MFDMKVGEFLDEDPTGFSAADTNLYRYVGNSPVNATDPTGQVISFPNQASADAFIADLRKLGAKSVVSATAAIAGVPTTYVLTDPRDVEAVFGYADQNLPVPAPKLPNGMAWDTRDMTDLPKQTIAAVHVRNIFLLASGVLGTANTVANVKGEPTGFAFKAVAQLLNTYRKGGPYTVAIDIGGEGRTGGAINFNVVSIGTVQPTSGKAIPRLMLREGEDAALPLDDGSVASVLVQATPILPQTAKEIARVIAPGGRIVLIGPAGDETVQKQQQGVIDALKGRSQVQQGVVWEDLNVAGNQTIKFRMLKTTITVNK